MGEEGMSKWKEGLETREGRLESRELCHVPVIFVGRPISQEKVILDNYCRFNDTRNISSWLTFTGTSMRVGCGVRWAHSTWSTRPPRGNPSSPASPNSTRT